MSASSPRWSPAQLRMFVREAGRRVRDAGQEMSLPPGYVDPFMTEPLKLSSADSRPGTLSHIAEVRRLMGKMLTSLTRRSLVHDQSKLKVPEVEHFDRAAYRLAECAYGSDEYKAGLADLKPALTHHYAVNSHHPEHHAAGIRGMCLMDLAEMLCDWQAASLRNPGGDVRRSVEVNQARFGYSDELKQILLNTLPLLVDEQR